MLVVILNAYAFPRRGLTGARIALMVVLGLTGAFALAWPLMRLNRRRSVATAEAASPELEQRLTTFSEKQEAGNDPFIELLAADTLKSHGGGAAPESAGAERRLLALAGAGRGMSCGAGVDDRGRAGVSGLWRFAAVDGAEARCGSDV